MDYPYQVAFEAFLANDGLAPTTIQAYHDSITHFFAYLADEWQEEPSVTKVTEADLRAYFSNRQNKHGMTLATYNKVLSHLNRYFRYLLVRQIITTYPTLALHGALPKVTQPLSTKWLIKLDELLLDQQLHPYVRLTLLLTSHGYQVSEFLQPGFAKVMNNLKPRSNAEQCFLDQFRNFHTPLAQLQACPDPFLKLRVNQAQPHLSNAGLHKFLKPAEEYLGMRLAPRFLYQSFIFYTLAQHPELSPQALADYLRLDPAALNYYQRQRLTLKAQGLLSD